MLTEQLGARWWTVDVRCFLHTCMHTVDHMTPGKRDHSRRSQHDFSPFSPVDVTTYGIDNGVLKCFPFPAVSTVGRWGKGCAMYLFSFTMYVEHAVVNCEFYGPYIDEDFLFRDISWTGKCVDRSLFVTRLAEATQCPGAALKWRALHKNTNINELIFWLTHVT